MDRSLVPCSYSFQTFIYLDHQWYVFYHFKNYQDNYFSQEWSVACVLAAYFKRSGS